MVLGPELLSYDDVSLECDVERRLRADTVRLRQAVKIASSVLGRQRTHKRISPKQATRNLMGAGLPEDLASFIVSLEQGTAESKDKILIFFRKRRPEEDHWQAVIVGILQAKPGVVGEGLRR